MAGDQDALVDRQLFQQRQDELRFQRDQFPNVVLSGSGVFVRMAGIQFAQHIASH